MLYRVTPVFEGSNLVASGVLIEAESVEDKGEDVLGVSCFWSIKELKEQEKRVAKGWFPKRKVDKHLQNHVAALWAGKVLAYLMGNYYDSKATYEKLFDWTDEHKFKTGKYSYKEAVIDELATAFPSEYLTKISIQVF